MHIRNVNKSVIFSGAKAQEKNQMAVLRMLANLFATKHGEELMIQNFEWVHKIIKQF